MSRRRTTKRCSVDGCEAKHVAKGYCRSHYDKKRNGHNFFTVKMKRSVKEHPEPKVTKSHTGQKNLRQNILDLMVKHGISNVSKEVRSLEKSLL